MYCRRGQHHAGHDVGRHIDLICIWLRDDSEIVLRTFKSNISALQRMERSG